MFWVSFCYCERSRGCHLRFLVWLLLWCKTHVRESINTCGLMVRRTVGVQSPYPVGHFPPASGSLPSPQPLWRTFSVCPPSHQQATERRKRPSRPGPSTLWKLFPGHLPPCLTTPARDEAERAAARSARPLLTPWRPAASRARYRCPPRVRSSRGGGEVSARLSGKSLGCKRLNYLGTQRAATVDGGLWPLYFRNLISECRWGCCTSLTQHS